MTKRVEIRTEGKDAGTIPLLRSVDHELVGIDRSAGRVSGAFSNLYAQANPGASSLSGLRAVRNTLLAISAAGAAGQALLLDCRSLAGDLVPLPESTSIIVLDTGTRRGLVDSAYNERRAQCEAAAAHFGIRALRDVDLSAFEARAHELDEVTGRRARHVISENERTTAAAAAMRAGDRAALGQLMDASHVSLRDDFEGSSESLDLIVECARPVDGCLGARMTGAGFGGCAVALVEADATHAFCQQVEAEYRGRCSNEPQLYVCEATDGAAVVTSGPVGVGGQG